MPPKANFAFKITQFANKYMSFSNQSWPASWAADNKIQNAALSGIQNQKCFDANWLKTEILYMLQKIHIFKMNTVNQNKIYNSIRNSHYWYSVPSVSTSWPQGFIHIRLKILSYNTQRKKIFFHAVSNLDIPSHLFLGLQQSLHSERVSAHRDGDNKLL